MGTNGSRHTLLQAAKRWFRDGALVALAMAIGWWAHSAPRVEAQSSNPVFQIQNLSGGTSLALYYPGDQIIYVYPNATVGYSKINCAYEFRLSRQGGTVQREQCKPPSFQP